MNRSTIAALDIGSSKVCCIIARVNKDKKIKIIGYGYNASKGIKNGIITDINQATLSVCNAVEDAEQKANERIDSVILNISGDKTLSTLQNTSVMLKKNRPISMEDIDKLIAKGTSKVNAGGNNEIIHCSTTTFKIDQGEDVKDPINLVGEELSVNVLLGMYPSNLYRNLASVVEAAHLDVDNRVFTAYASGLSCLVEDEREYGATIVDIGGGTTSIATFKNGMPIAFSTIPVGGMNITRDITQGLTTSFAHAEDLKIRHGCAFGVSHDEYENLNVYPLGEEDDSSIRQIHRSDLIKIIAPRVEETFELIDQKLTLHGLKNRQNHRVVLTGGCSQLPGIRAVANLILDKQVRLGGPRNIQGLPEKLSNNPVFSTALGLLMFATNNLERKPKKIINKPVNEAGTIAKIFNWIRQNS
ncbi:MAG: cell division protein FtsA [Alphaproteobacteria bacterium]|nr:cell division protein FtsA [Alphaproteobacteria bacterium]